MGNRNITNIKLIPGSFNTYITEIGPKLARVIEISLIRFDRYIGKCNITQPECLVTINELKDAFYSLKNNKNPGYDEVSFNVLKHCFGVL